MKKIITIVGARPQFIKAAMVSRAIIAHNSAGINPIQELILHTGQHYDHAMSSAFFSDLGIPQPAWTLSCAADTHGKMTGMMLTQIEEILLAEKPNAIIVYGDTNTTLAGALAAAKLNISVVHIEAGLRSHNRNMPEELNRIVTDHLSTILCCPTVSAMRNLALEGIATGVYHVGDVMYDAAITFGDVARRKSDIMAELGIQPKAFRLCTVHRAENTDNFDRLNSIFDALLHIASDRIPIILPLHPRTEARLAQFGILHKIRQESGKIRLIPPAGFLDMAALEMHALNILTDSGGVQKEAYFHRVPCITLRSETEWIETVAAGWNIIAGHDKDSIIAAVSASPNRLPINEYGRGDAAKAIVGLL
ncbi:MAG: UDP-N-acetylglucosamine 2-epimerase (non-hydrolyzing) [Tannerellaceae bacterium]|jgi:UDP-GlcNAc3NAcA epimerase|nr:UDP-N-acetylglucosamine 2-epimerase (non-hydrolyzing) [Tannerellaceae bacterium]